MKGLTPTGVEYADYHWSAFTGCAQPAGICLTRTLCWARVQHERFWMMWGDLYNTDFSPRFNKHILEAPLHLRKPSRILVGFMGDMFGPGVPLEWQREVLWAINRGNIYSEVAVHHRYLFLTKSPENLAQFNPWPDNAWVGTSITGAESPERQQSMIAQLANTEGGKRWISYEPMLGPFAWPSFLCNIDWLVVGAQTGPGAVKPELGWVLDIVEAAENVNLPLWIKTNLAKIYPQLPRRQERPS